MEYVYPNNLRQKFIHNHTSTTNIVYFDEKKKRFIDGDHMKNYDAFRMDRVFKSVCFLKLNYHII
jgi:hypothetical protein